MLRTRSEAASGLDALARLRQRRMTETLGAMPRESLSAMAGYGLTDGEIARYFGLPRPAVTTLRFAWGIDGDAADV